MEVEVRVVVVVVFWMTSTNAAEVLAASLGSPE